MDVGTPRDASRGRQKAAAIVVADAVEQLRNLGFQVSYELDEYKSGRLNLYLVARVTPPPAWILVEDLIRSTAQPDREEETHGDASA